MLKALFTMTWAASAFAFAILLSTPVNVEAQLAVGATLIGVMMAIHLLKLTGIFRQIFFALATAVILRYLFWRVTETMPPIDQFGDFAVGAVLLAAEFFCIGMFAMSLFVNADPLERGRAPRIDPQKPVPTVDVLVPSYNEDVDLLAVTLSAAKAMHYPAGFMRVCLLDDGGTTQKCESADPATSFQALRRREKLQALCKELDVTYVTRERNEHAKAGNLNSGLAETSGDLIAVFDADHAPTRDFLIETVGHFQADEKLFLVQTPHFFVNPDPIERNLSLFERTPPENEMFYSAVQKGLDKWNAAFFCGSAAVLRRSALEMVGGFSGASITEDCETALELHSRGWNSRYVDRPLIAGLQPETFEAFIGQRSRWCRGMLQILMLKNPLSMSGLTIAQRVSYLSSSMFWMFPVPRMIFTFAPLLYIFFDMQIYMANKQEFIAYTGLYMISAFMVQSYVFGKVRWPWISELYEYLQSVYLIRAIFGVLVNPRAPKFNVTAKNQTLDDSALSGLALPYFAIFGLLSAAMAMVVYRYLNEPNARELLVVIGIWNTFNMIIAGCALGVLCETRQRRKDVRMSLARKGAVLCGDVETPVIIEDVSIGGVRVRPIHGKLAVSGVGRTGALRVDGPNGQASIEVPIGFTGMRTDARGSSYGLKFISATTAQFQAVADLAYADLTALRRSRVVDRQQHGLVAGSVRFALLGLKQTLRGLGYALIRRGGSPKLAPPEGQARALPASR